MFLWSNEMGFSCSSSKNAASKKIDLKNGYETVLRSQIRNLLIGSEFVQNDPNFKKVVHGCVFSSIYKTGCLKISTVGSGSATMIKHA